jgi:hypothetical protein
MITGQVFHLARTVYRTIFPKQLPKVAFQNYPKNATPNSLPFLDF